MRNQAASLFLSDGAAGRSSRRHVLAGATAALAAVGGFTCLYRLGQTWGATDQELQQVLAGDELLPDARAKTTHAITIAAPPHMVWSWLVQMGWGRAGWYTYRWVDRLLFPANGPSADHILPEHQRLEQGDHVPDGPPEVDCWFTVERIEPDRLLVLRSTQHLPLSWRQRGLAMDWIWSWQLDAPTCGSTRVVQRNRMCLRPWWFERAFLGAIVPADFVMARSHLRGLQRRAEAAEGQATASAGPDSGLPIGNQRCQTSTLPCAGKERHEGSGDGGDQVRRDRRDRSGHRRGLHRTWLGRRGGPTRAGPGG
jgi:hypothetical protein